MTRKLPWRDGVSTKASLASSARSSLTPGPARQVKPEAKESGAESKSSTPLSAAPKKRVKRPTNRSASTSPPPEPLQERFMVEGYDDDDRYRMVEDEFNATAQSFTAHLHAVEYQKLKDAAKSQNAETIKNISRPVVGRMTDLVKKKQHRAGLSKRQKSATNGDMTGDVTEDDTYLQGTSLFGLMQSPRKKVPRLNSINPTHSLTRAAAGFGKGFQPDMVSELRSSKEASKPSVNLGSNSEYQDELDALPRRISTIPTIHQAKSVAPEAVERTVNPATPHTPQRRRFTSQPQPQPTEEDMSEDAAQSSDGGSGGALFGFQKRAQLSSRVRRKDSSGPYKPGSTKSAHDNVIPGFL